MLEIGLLLQSAILLKLLDCSELLLQGLFGHSLRIIDGAIKFPKIHPFLQDMISGDAKKSLPLT